MKCIIVDDERLACNLINEYVQKIPDLETAAQFQNALEAITYLQSHEVDIAFLDIQMPDISGMDLVRSLPSKPLIIFTTAYTEYAAKSYELQVVDYLVKPFSLERFVQAVNKARDLLAVKGQISRRADIAPGTGKEDPRKDYFFVKMDYKQVKVRYRDILYIEGMKEYVSLRMEDGSRIVFLETMKKLEEDLAPLGFVRIHKSYIVPRYRIDAIAGNQVEIGGTKLPVGKSYRHIIEDLLK